jgi:hypothetical protein
MVPARIGRIVAEYRLIFERGLSVDKPARSKHGKLNETDQRWEVSAKRDDAVAMLVGEQGYK